MKERTLTGKNFYARDRDKRGEAVQKMQKQRDKWESKHLGNF